MEIYQYQNLEMLWNTMNYKDRAKKLKKIFATLAAKQEELDRQINTFRHLNLESKIIEQLADSTQDEFLTRAIKLVNVNLTDCEFGNDEFVKNMNHSRALVYKRLKELTGQTVSEFIRNIRLEAAAHLFAKSNTNVSTVCYQVGFKFPCAFSRYFSKRYGISPRSFIKGLRKDTFSHILPSSKQ